MNDALGVLASTRPIIEQARFVTIDRERIEAVARDLVARSVSPEPWASPHHFADGTERTVTAVFVLDALNFCFWSGDPRSGARWRIAIDGELLDGYWALAAAIKRGIEEGMPLTDAAYLATIPEADVRRLLRPANDGDPPIPLFEARVANLRELGAGLLAIGGDAPAATLVSGCGESAIALVRQVVSRFPSFDDRAVFQGREVRFYKRAQILISDLAGAFDGAGYGAFRDLAELTAFADYKVPQVLRHLGILTYAEPLAGRIRRFELIPANSIEELEIRAATIWGVEFLRQSLAGLGRPLPASDIDWLLWQSGQQLPTRVEPYHRTLTMFY